MIMQKGSKVKRIHPDYPGSYIKQGQLYTVDQINDLHLTLVETGEQRLFLVAAFEEVEEE
jgi:hypothetical protein